MFLGKILLILALVFGSSLSHAERVRENSTKKMIDSVESEWNSTEQLIFRSYKVNADLADLLMAHHNADAGDSVSVEAFFSDIPFAQGSSAMFMPAFNSLFVQQTSANISRIESLLKSYQHEQRQLEAMQVEIEVKIMEVSQNSLNELGFDWTFIQNKVGEEALQIVDDLVLNPNQALFSSGLRGATTALNAGTASAVQITKGSGDLQWDLIINALEQSGDSEVLSAPRIVTLDGSTAVIQVGEERMIPKSFEVNNQETSPYVEHSDWDLELMGIYMEVTPELRDGGFIDLEINPRVVDVVGYDRYRILPAYEYPAFIEHVAGISQSAVTAPLEGSLPYLRVREMETRVTVANGNTIGMGGLIYDKSVQFKDSVPFLGNLPYIGRFFRSEGSKSVKRNLMIFVTASIIDLDGETTAAVVQNK